LSPTFRPLIKWPGGKAREWKQIAPFLPSGIRHFVDPFVGGGAPFGSTPFKGDAFLNDRHERLVDLYLHVQRGDAELARELMLLAGDWVALGSIATSLTEPFRDAVERARLDDAPDARAVQAALADALGAAPLRRSSAGGRTALAYLAHSAADKARRVANLERRHEMVFDAAAVAVHGETAVRAGYYTLVRAHERTSQGAAGVADFVFVRDYCYGAMFRAAKDGGFNIPYGGTSYNGKSFAAHAARLVDPRTARSLERARISSSDFEPFLRALLPDLGPQDLVFVDPPYHSEFSTYGEHAFDLDDHARLAALLFELPCRFVQVIKGTPEVEALYTSSAARAAGVRIAQRFGKQYGYNVRGRNERGAQHLIIVNG
jgi:DNA adenine methylase